MLHQPKAPEWVEAADLGRDKDMNHPFLSRQALVTPVTTFINLVLDPLGNVVIKTPNFHVYISASLGYHMRHVDGKDGYHDASIGTPVYTAKEKENLQGMPGVPHMPKEAYDGGRERSHKHLQVDSNLTGER